MDIFLIGIISYLMGSIPFGFILAKILKIDKGNLSIGNDADLCMVDIDKPWIVKKEKLISKSKNTSIEDKKLQGKVTNTFVKGKELFKL